MRADKIAKLTSSPLYRDFEWVLKMESYQSRSIFSSHLINHSRHHSFVRAGKASMAGAPCAKKLEQYNVAQLTHSRFQGGTVEKNINPHHSFEALIMLIIATCSVTQCCN